jgi:hypothetical protein
MARKSRKQLTIAGLLLCGYEETFRSSKWRTFAKTAPVDCGVTWMVGKSGGLRRTLGALNVSLSATDSAIHEAFAYVGEVCPTVSPVPSVSKCMEIAIEHRNAHTRRPSASV